MPETPSYKISFFGAQPDTTNMGVSALCFSTVQGLTNLLGNVEFTIFDNGRGLRHGQTRVNQKILDYNLYGAVNSRRFYRPESMWQTWFRSLLHLPGSPGLEAVRASNAVLSMSGGDSFTDLYGSRVFDSVALPKLIALMEKKLLILLPQTYGPFQSAHAKKVSAKIVRECGMAWARDEHSFEILKGLLGDAFDPERHRCGVDMAFGLERHEPELSPEFSAWLMDSSRQVIGFNISGLMFKPDSPKRFGITADYPKVVVSVIRRLLKETDNKILLTPHVLRPPGHPESDPGGCQWVMEQLGESCRDRVRILDLHYNQSEIKWIISRLEWFCGTRMHSTIAALSSGVPTAAIAYSDKTLGVFATCGQAACVADPRKLSTDEMIEHLWQSWCSRSEARASLEKQLPRVMQTHGKQMQAIADMIRQAS